MVDIKIGRFQLVIEGLPTHWVWAGLRLGRYNVWWNRGEGWAAERVPDGIRASL